MTEFIRGTEDIPSLLFVNMHKKNEVLKIKLKIQS
jgi:hypothetical protein